MDKSNIVALFGKCRSIYRDLADLYDWLDATECPIPSIIRETADCRDSFSCVFLEVARYLEDYLREYVRESGKHSES